MSAPADWGRRNLRLLGVFAPVLVLTGVGGLVLPPGSSPMSAAAPYDVFHLAAGALGVAIVYLARSPRLAAAFNLGFGAIDLYQALAGVLGLFPAGLFGLRPADHVVHVVLGALLVACGRRAAGPSSPAIAASRRPGATS